MFPPAGRNRPARPDRQEKSRILLAGRAWRPGWVGWIRTYTRVNSPLWRPCCAGLLLGLRFYRGLGAIHFQNGPPAHHPTPTVQLFPGLLCLAARFCLDGSIFFSIMCKTVCKRYMYHFKYSSCGSAFFCYHAVWSALSPPHT